MEAPIVNPPVPYIGYINNGFRGGRLVRVQGRINHNSHGFKIELLCGPNPNHDDVALHFNPRFSENVVIRNSRNYSSWGTEERHGSGFPFIRGQAFEVLILCEPQHFKIAINGQHYAEFDHRVPIERISHLAVDGDITIALVQFDGGSSPSDSDPSASAPPMGSGPAYAPPTEVYGNPPPYGSAQPGFVPPPYPMHSGGAGIPPFPPQPAYASGAHGYPPPGGPYQPPVGPYPPQHGYPPPAYGAPGQGTYPSGPPGAYPSQPGYYPGQPHGQYPPGMQQGYPGAQPYPPKSGGGLMDSAGKLLAGVGLAGVANKIPGLGGHGHGGHGGPGYGGQGGGHSSGGFPGGAGGVMGGAAALGIGGALAAKMLKPKKMKKMKKGKALKYGLPLAGVGLGGYALHKGMHGHHGFRRGSSSSSSSSGSSE